MQQKISEMINNVVKKYEKINELKIVTSSNLYGEKRTELALYAGAVCFDCSRFRCWVCAVGPCNK